MADAVCGWIDAGAGVAGDMLMAALLDAGADEQRVIDAVGSLGISGLAVRTERSRRGGFRCLRVVVATPEEPAEHRPLEEVLALVERTNLGGAAGACARGVFELLARAEGVAHGIPADRVHLHEVGALDALADVVGCAAALDGLGLLGADATVTCSALGVGSGTVRAEHGVLPIPAPGVLQIAAGAGLSLAGGELIGERTTPTGAALVAAIATPGVFPPMTVRSVGVGGGSRDTPDRPNITRVVLGTASGSPQRTVGDVLLVESTIDDLDPQLWPSVLRAVRGAGAWDCWTAEITARNGRPGRVLTAVCDESVREAVVDTVFHHTTTIGVRWSRWHRASLPRRSVTVQVGPAHNRRSVSVKVSDLGDGSRTVKPEIDDVESAAVELGRPVRALLDEVMSALHRDSG